MNGKPLVISEKECARLIRESGDEPGRTLRLTYPGGRLFVEESNLWALRIVRDMRAADVSAQEERT